MPQALPSIGYTALDESGDLTTSIGSDTQARRLTVRAARHPARGLLAALALGSVFGATGCSQLPFSAAWNPWAAAPPTPVAPWRASDGNKQPRLAVLIDRLNKEVQIDPDKEHTLADLIDLAQRLHPGKRRERPPRGWAARRARGFPLSPPRPLPVLHAWWRRREPRPGARCR